MIRSVQIKPVQTVKVNVRTITKLNFCVNNKLNKRSFVPPCHSFEAPSPDPIILYKFENTEKLFKSFFKNRLLPSDSENVTYSRYTTEMTSTVCERLTCNMRSMIIEYILNNPDQVIEINKKFPMLQEEIRDHLKHRMEDMTSLKKHNNAMIKDFEEKIKRFEVYVEKLKTQNVRLDELIKIYSKFNPKLEEIIKNNDNDFWISYKGPSNIDKPSY